MVVLKYHETVWNFFYLKWKEINTTGFVSLVLFDQIMLVIQELNFQLITDKKTFLVRDDSIVFDSIINSPNLSPAREYTFD